MKTEVAARRLDRMEREKDDADDAEREANLQEALADQSQVAKLIVDKWFVDKASVSAGQQQEKSSSSTPASCKAPMCSWSALTNGRKSSTTMLVPRGYRARRAWGRNVWIQERDKEKANRVAQQVRRAVALTAELVAHSEKKTAAVCDQPPGLDELAGHIEAPRMGAVGSHLQATIMPDLWAPGSLPSSNSEVSSLAPLNQGSFVFPGKARGARPRSTMRAQDNAATLEEMLSLFVEAIGMDKGSLTLPLGWRSVKMRRR